MRWSTLVAGLFALASCAQRTEVIVGIATNLSTPGQVDVVRMRVEDTDGNLLLAREWPVGPDLSKLPASIGLSPGSSSASSYLVTIEGRQNAGTAADGSQATTLKVSRKSQFSFITGHSLFLRMTLLDRCYGQLDGVCPPGQWCAEGVCKPVAFDSSSMPDYSPGDENKAQCGDYSQALGLSPPPAVTCGAGKECVEAECFGPSGPAVDGPPPALPDLTPVAPPDLYMTPADATVIPDLSPPPDLTGVAPPDLFHPDMFHPDLILPDLFGDDFTYLPDLATPDLVTPPDMTVPDLSMPDFSLPDLHLPDFKPPPPPPDLLPLDLLPPGPTVYPPVQIVSYAGETILGAYYDGTASNTTGSALWAVNAGGNALYLKSGVPTLELTGAGFPLNAVVAVGKEVWAVGNGNAFMHRDANGTWTTLPFPSGFVVAPPGMVSISAAPNNTVIAVGNQSDPSYAGVEGAPLVLRADSTSVSAYDALTNFANGPQTTMQSVYMGSNCGMMTAYGYTQQSTGIQPSFVDSSLNTWTTPPIVNPFGLYDIPNKAPPFPPIIGQAGCGQPGTLITGTNRIDHSTSTATGTLIAAVLQANGTWKDVNPGYTSEGSISGTVGVAGNPSDAYAWLLNVANPNSSTWVHWNGTVWSKVASNFPFVPTAMPVLAVGKTSGGTTYLGAFVGQSLYEQQSGGSWALNAAAAPAFHFDGKPWSDGNGTLIAPSGGKIWYTTDTSQGVKSTWASSTITSGKTLSNITQVFGVSTGNGAFKYYATADQGVLLSATSLTSGFTVEFDTGGGATEQLTGVWAADSNNVFVVSSNGSAGGAYGKVSGGAWASLTPPAIDSFDAVFGFSASEVYFGGRIKINNSYFDSAIYRWNGSFSTTLIPANNYTSSIYAIWGTGTHDLWAVGDGGAAHGINQIYRETGSSFLRFPSPSVNPLRAIHGTASNDVFAVGDGGSIFGWDGNGWTPIPSPTGTSFDGVWAEKKRVWVGGSDTLLVMPR